MLHMPVNQITVYIIDLFKDSIYYIIMRNVGYIFYCL